MARHHTYAQHFLRSPRLVAELIGHSNLRKNDIVYDLGAGSGIIAAVLAPRVKHVYAAEIEPNTLQTLRANLGHDNRVTILNQDILSLHPKTPYKIFANIPFSISSQVVQHYLFVTTPPKSMYLITQKQFARKLVPGSDHFTSQLGAEISPWFGARIRRPLRRSDFTPPPGVDTVLLEIKPLEAPLLDVVHRAPYRLFIQQCFSRQKYFTSLRREEAGISSELRPSQLTPTQWVKLYETTQ